MAARTYVCGSGGTVRRLDDLVGVNTAGINPNWVDVSLLAGGIASGSVLTLYDVETDPTNGDKVIAVGDTNLGLNPTYFGLALSINKGVTWVIPGGTYGADILAFGQAPLFREVTWVDANTIYACSQTGHVIKSTDGGLTFAICAGALPVTISEAWSINFTTPLIGVVGGNDRAAYTNNGGVTWTHLNGGFSFSQTGNFAGILVGALILPTLTDISFTSQNFQLISTDTGATFSIAISFDTLNSHFGQHLTWNGDGTLSAEVTQSGEARIQGTAGFILPGQTIITGCNPCDDQFGAHLYDSNKGFITSSGLVDGQIHHSTNNFNTLIQQDAWTGIIPQAIWTWINNNPPPPNYCGCPAGYTYNILTGLCEKVTTTSTSNPNPIAIGPILTKNSVNNIWGAVLYPDITTAAFPITGNPLIGIPTSPPGTGAIPYISYPQLRDATLTPLVPTGGILPTPGNITWGWDGLGSIPNSGRLNGAGIWPGLPGVLSQWGMDFCQNIPTTKTYILGISADDAYKITINGQLIIDTTSSGYGFPSLSLFPITLSAGINTFKIEGFDTGLNTGLAFEIYNATFPQLQAVLNAAALTPYLLFTAYSLLGQNVTSGSGPGVITGYTCGQGCNVNVCGIVPVCNCIETLPYNPCCFLLTDCNGVFAPILTNTDLSLVVGKIITIAGDPNCYLVTTAPGCQGSVAVTLLLTYDTCVECEPVCYLLVDCVTQETIKVSDDYSLYVGKIVNLANSGTRCWEVFLALDCIGAIDSGTTVTVVYNTCAQCLPFIPPPPVDLHPRRVKPGYYTAGCPPDYTERVNCAFAEGVYDTMLVKRYGITPCCGDDLEKWDIKKQLLDLRAIYDPALCKSTFSVCCPPTCLTAEVQVFTPIMVCDPPSNVISDIEIPPSPCPAPEDAISGIILYPLVPCVCYLINVTLGPCTFTYNDCMGVPQVIIVTTQAYVCSTSAPTTLCPPTSYTLSTTLGSCASGTCGP